MVEVVIGCAGNLIARIGEKLISETQRHLGYVLSHKKYINGLKQQLDMLKIKWEGITLDVEEAKRNGDIVAPEVEQWYDDVEIIWEDSTRFLEKEVQKTKSTLNGWFPNIKGRYILSKKAKSKTVKLASLNAVAFRRIAHPAPPLAVGDRSIGEFRNFESRMPTINLLMKLLKDDTRQIISICGMGGSGKTTMVKEVARRVKGEKLFDEIIMAVVSKEPDLMRVQEELAKWLGLKFKAATLDGRADELWKRLLQSKKGNLVILDDVWKRIDLERIGIPFGKGFNCKVVLTSRSIDACKMMGCGNDDILGLDVLTPSETWTLLGEMVGESLKDPDLLDTASEIAKKCGGLPIAIVCLGRSLKDKKKEVWNDTLQKLQKNIVPENIEGVREDVYKSLQASYDLLEDEEAQKIFLLCCMYPEYANVPLEALVRSGTGLDFFRGVDILSQVRDRVHSLTDKLKSRFLLLSGDRKSTVKIHSVVRAVGISVASTSKLNARGFKAMVIHEDRWPRGTAFSDCNAVSVVSNEISELPTRRSSFLNLYFLQLSCPKLSLEKLNTMFDRMQSVKVVELWNMSISPLASLFVSLPRDIFVLCMDCTMETIGDIRPEEFTNLEILSLGNCDIRELPRQIGKFANLRLLDLSRCHSLERISPGVISSLCLLEELDTGSKWWGEEEEGDASLAELESLTYLIYLGIRIKSSSCLPKYSLFGRLQRYVISVGIDLKKSRSFNNKMLLLKLENTDSHLGGGIDKLLQRNTEKVFLSGDGIKTALNDLVPSGFQQVKYLTVECCNNEGTEYLYDYRYASNGNAVFSNLEKLHMEKMWHLKGILSHNIKNVASNGLPVKSFSRLRKIHLSVLPEMTHLFSQSVATNLVHLESLHIEYCTSMQEVILNPRPSALSSTTENKIVFPKLLELIINDVVSLICFSQGINLQLEFPQLRVLKLEYIQNFLTFCPEEIFHNGTKLQPLIDHKVEFSSLAELTITNVGNIKEVWCGHLPNLVHLQGLYIQFCHMMEEVIFIQRPSVTTKEEKIVFLKLKEVILFGLNRLTYFCRGIDHVEFPQLRILRLRWLTHFRTFCREENAGRHPSYVFNDKVSFPSLETLEVSELDSVEELWSSQLPTSQFGKLKYLRVEKCHKLVNIFPSDLETLFPNLEKLEVEKCDSLEQVWGSKGIQIRNLKSIIVYDCPSLMNLCSLYTFKGLSNLQIIDISNCKLMVNVVADENKDGITIEPLSVNKLEQLNLAFLPNLNCFSETKCDIELTELTHVIVKSCPEMITFSESSVITPKLQFAVVEGVKMTGDLNSTIRAAHAF
uniref:probable disease resistance protein At4g27220 n=1 Tax=Erigeron canadensis TaxID=72917 RepID=UPI001CB9773B|nr:probable disease resistance protein At4g27220 [Erigeron canadensis]